MTPYFSPGLAALSPASYLLLVGVAGLLLTLTSCTSPPPPGDPLPLSTYGGIMLPTAGDTPPTFIPCSLPERWFVTADTTRFAPNESPYRPPVPKDTLQAYASQIDSSFDTRVTLQDRQEAMVNREFQFPPVHPYAQSLGRPQSVVLKAYTSNVTHVPTPSGLIRRVAVVQSVRPDSIACAGLVSRLRDLATRYLE